MMNSCKNDKIELQMVDSCMELHEVANWMVTYYKFSFDIARLKYILDLILWKKPKIY
jgi:hypothetical protein